MKIWLIGLTCLIGFAIPLAHAQEQRSKPLRALLIAGGCCHDYASQQEAICKGIQSRANVQVDVYWTDNSSTTPVLPLYAKLNWAEEYDIIIHDECAADIRDPAIVNRIVQTHQRIPAVHLHCAMHSFRTGTDAWFKHLGLQSSGHGPQEPIDIHFVDKTHPITETLSDWKTIREELYNNVKILGAHPLAIGKQAVTKGDKIQIEDAVVAWTNESSGARSFSTTIGHNTETVKDSRYLELITRGLLWACNKLTPEYLVPYSGENKVTFIDKTKVTNPSDVPNSVAPKDATLVKVTSSSSQKGNEDFQAIDGKRETRWCANGPDYPQSLQLEFETTHVLKEIEIIWESSSSTYQYRIEGSIDGTNWITLLDKSTNTDNKQTVESIRDKTAVKFVRITGMGSTGGWCSIWEVKMNGDGIGPLWPADPKKTDDKKGSGAFAPLHSDPFVNRGNIPPRIEKLSVAEEAEILKDVQVPEGFDVTVFASPPAVNYPVFVASSVDGTLYVSSDGNGSLGRNPQRGRVIRLRDLDNDGRADETKVFCEVDAPRGLVWDHDRLYLMHPPNLSAFIDHDGDGVADEQITLVKDLAFGYDKRPADHTTNGVSLGVDGWLYIAGGDFGFVNAQGTDGRKLTHRGGGVIRVRPDGTGLEVYSTGTRNILEVAISPQMDLFARDNTNDGGGWDVRMHHFTGMDDHGYPRLYKNFSNECVQPLADYGGGSGCGAVYIDEPGFGVWGNAPFTADWGTGALYRHSVSPIGATFAETAKPESFIKMTRPTDADVDGNSRVYCASWRGATFDWNGPDVGYIVCVKPKNYTPPVMPNFGTSSDSDLVEVLNSPSYRRRLEAERELLRRGNSAYTKLNEAGVASRTDARNHLDKLQSTTTTNLELIEAASSNDPVISHTAIRCLAKRNAYEACFAALDLGTLGIQPILRALGMMHVPKVVDGLISRLSQVYQRDTKQEILSTLCRLHYHEGDWKGDSWGTRPDTRGPYYQPEPWSETLRIANVLRNALQSGTPDEVARLIESMTKNRIPSDDALNQLIELAASNTQLIDTAINQLLVTKEIPEKGVELLLKVVKMRNASSKNLADSVVLLSKVDRGDVPNALLRAMTTLDTSTNETADRIRARDAFINAPKLDSHLTEFVKSSLSEDPTLSKWSDAAILAIAFQAKAGPEAIAVAKNFVDQAWQMEERREQLINAAIDTNNHYLDDRILAIHENPKTDIANVVMTAMDRLKIKPKMEDKSVKVGLIELSDATSMVVSARGDVELGKQVFARATCVACHTVSQNEIQKGPYLGNIAKTYKRPELTAAILYPSKTIAQGFATNVILTKDEVVFSGFVTNEQPDQITIRDQQGKEVAIMKTDIEERKTSPTSVMPAGLMNDFSTHELASLLDYLESIAK